jgi:hypothetical protein
MALNVALFLVERVDIRILESFICVLEIFIRVREQQQLESVFGVVVRAPGARLPTIIIISFGCVIVVLRFGVQGKGAVAGGTARWLGGPRTKRRP